MIFSAGYEKAQKAEIWVKLGDLSEGVGWDGLGVEGTIKSMTVDLGSRSSRRKDLSHTRVIHFLHLWGKGDLHSFRSIP